MSGFAYLSAGVALPEVGALSLPRDLSCVSLSLCSSSSARRLRNSESFTSPTVCDLSRSSVVEFCAVKRALAITLGVELREGEVDEELDISCG